MSTVIILTETVLHLTYAVSIREKCFHEERLVIVWFGSNSVIDEYPFLFEEKNIEYIFISNPNKNNFFLMHDSIKEINYKISHLKNQNCKLITYYDTHPGFEIIRDILSIPWDRIGLLEDGQANYFSEISMPSIQNRVIKHCINKLLGRFPVNLSRYNLGGNKLIKLMYVMSPKYTFTKNPTKVKIVPIMEHVKGFLEGIEFEVSEEFRKMDAFLTLAPVYSYGRLDKKQLFSYIKKTIKELNSKIIVVKPHMRDSELGIREDISELKEYGVVLAPNLPTEFLFHEIPETKWIGNASTSMLNRHFLYPDYRDTFHISFEGKSQFFNQQRRCMKRILRDKYKID